MIDKRAIEKAIEGGWKPFKSFIVVADGEWEHYSDQWTYRAPGMGGMPARISEGRIALDPAFWQALGKALGWDTATGYYPDFQSHKYNQIGVYAHQFYDLILTNQDPAPFWEELLGSNKNEAV